MRDLLLGGANASVLVFVVSSTLGVGLRLTVRQILTPLGNGRLVALSLAANFVLIPISALALARLLGLDEPLRVGLLLCGVAAGAPFLLKLAELARGDMAFAVGLMVLLMVITVGYIPIVLPAMLEGVTVDAAKIARSLVFLMLLPLAAGLMVKARFEKVASRVSPLVGRLSSVSMIFVVALTTAAHLRSVLGVLGSYAIVAAVVFTAFCAGAGWLLGGPGAETRGVLALGTAQRNTAAALVVAGQNFGDPKVVVMITVVMIVSFGILMPFAGVLARRGQAQRAVLLALIICVWASDADAQVRGVYPTGMSATNSGGTPDPGLTYSNLFLFNSRDQLRGPDGELMSTGNNSVMIDMNTLVWVSERERLGGARFSAAVTLLVSTNSLTSDTEGPLSSGGGFADSFYQPIILGWKNERADVRVAYGILAPTGRFDADANDNVGSGYWTHAPSIGVTVYLTPSKTTAISAFHMYEFHTTQKDTDIQPGQTANLDYSLTQTIPLQTNLQLQLGLIGYGQWQTTDKSGPAISAEQAAAHYAVNALGFASNLIFAERSVSLSLKYLKELSSRSTFQGYTLQISTGITF